MLLAWLPLAAACPPGEALAPDRLPGLPLVGAVMGGPGSALLVPAGARLPVPVSAPARAEVVFEGACAQGRIAASPGETRIALGIADEGPLGGPSEPAALGTLRVRLGDREVSRPVTAVGLVSTAEGWSTTLTLVDPDPPPPSGPDQVLTWGAGGQVFEAGGAEGDAWLLEDLGLLFGSPDRLSPEDRLALFRLWARDPQLVPMDTVVALQSRRVSAAERAALGPLLYPAGDRRYAGARVVVAGSARLLANGREVVGHPAQEPFGGRAGPTPVTVFTLPIGGDVWLRVEGERGAHEHRVVVDPTSRVEIASFMILGDRPRGERRYETAPGASFTLCEGRPLVDGVCPRWSANTPSPLHATANLGAEERAISFEPIALGTYTLSWGEADIRLAWTPLAP